MIMMPMQSFLHLVYACYAVVKKRYQNPYPTHRF